MQGKARAGAQISISVVGFVYSIMSFSVCLCSPGLLRGKNNCHLPPWEQWLLVGARQLGIGKGRNRSPGCHFERVLSACVGTTCPWGYRASRPVAAQRGTLLSCLGLGLFGHLQTSPEPNHYQFWLLVDFSHF